jgi:hypothetical protein
MTSFAAVAKQQAALSAATTTTTATTDTTTWNGAVSHLTSGAARVDFFYGAMRGVDKARFVELLDKSFAEDALHTLKLIAYVRDCRGGKGERELGRWALERLAEKYPRELLQNLTFFVGDFGRFDDVVALMNSPVEKSALDLLAKQLEADLAVLKQDEGEASTKVEEEDEQTETKKHKARMQSISLCAKWVPSEKKALDKKLQMNKKLSKHMGLKPAQLRKLYLSPLRERLRILERFMCAKDWDAINFNAVPSVAMHIHGKPKHAFERHLGEKFSEWKDKLVKGETKVNAKTLFPHQVVAECMGRSQVDELLEAQWKVLMEEAVQTGDLRKTLVLSDVSGSMSGRPMQVSIALGLMISSLAQDEYKDLVLTFETEPRFHHVEGDSLHARVRNLLRAPWGGTTDFAKAFRAVLKVAVDAKLEKDQMLERLIVVSDMQFNSADSNFETNYQVLKRDFEAAGYDVPHLVFWNVNGATRDVPTYSGQAKVSLVSGFSTAILKSVLTGTQITPLQTVLNVVTDERYDSITLPPTMGGDGIVEEEEEAVLL